MFEAKFILSSVSLSNHTSSFHILMIFKINNKRRQRKCDFVLMFVIHFSIQITISDIRCVLFRLSVWLCQVVSPNSLVNNIVIVYLFITVLNNSQINQIMYNIELVWILSECAVFCRQIKINLNQQLDCCSCTCSQVFFF